MAGRKLELWFVIVVVAALEVAPALGAEKETQLYLNNVEAYCDDSDDNGFQNIVLSDTNSPNSNETKHENQKLNGNLNVIKKLTDVTVTGKVWNQTFDIISGGLELKLEITNYVDFCKHVLDDDHFWNNITNSIKDFPKTCPIPVGNYSIVDAPVNLNDFAQKYRLTEGNWLIDLVFANTDDGADTPETFACLSFEFGHF